uniref:G-protein coupled receptors family 1 profile domain-containing protein n=1 Tax=Pan paniscus TaxID=9597 RepID=A0A2R8ZBZ4_PANPA
KKAYIIDPKCNGTEVTEFILLGLTSQPELQPMLFVVFLLIYLITLTGNFGMIFLIRFTPQLQTRMYFFLTHLACVDIFYSTNLVNFLSEKKTISYVGCLAQCFVFVTLLLTEYYMLGAMAYDCYMAICNPLHYSSKMSRAVCICLVTFPYFWGSMVGTMQVILTSPGINLTVSLLIILISYIFIFITIMRIRSSKGKRKGFSTCGSHLTAVTMFYGSLFCMYLRPTNELSVEQGKMVVVPMLNPFIYSLRNKDVKQALKRVFMRNLGKMKKTSVTTVSQ